MRQAFVIRMCLTDDQLHCLTAMVAVYCRRYRPCRCWRRYWPDWQSRTDRQHRTNGSWRSHRRIRWGQTSIYLRIVNHVRISSRCSQTNDSCVMATAHVVACCIMKRLPSFHQILQFCFWENQHSMCMLFKQFCIDATHVCCQTAARK